jgi:Domain of unknown function (DUF4412)
VSRSSLRIPRWVVAAVLVALPALAGAQDVYIESTTHTDAVKMMGHEVPAQDGVNRTWIGDGRLAVEDAAAGTLVIFRADQSKMYLVNTKDSTYYESPVPFHFPPEVAKMMASMRPEVTVTPTGESKVVAGFNAILTKVAIKMMGQDIQMAYWVSKDVGVPREQVQKLTQAMFAGNPMLGEVADKLAAMDGYPVRVETTVSAMGSTFGSWQEVQKVEKKAAPPGTYEVPADFKKTSRMPTAHS